MIKPKFSLMRNGFAVVVDEKRYSKLRNYKENSKGEKSMLAYKAFNKNLTGHGGFQFEIGKTYETKEANQRQNGFHCAENPLDCFYYYGLNDRFCEVEAEGDIDDGDASGTRNEGQKTTEMRTEEPEVVTGEVEKGELEEKNEVCDTAQTTDFLNKDGRTVRLPLAVGEGAYMIVPEKMDENGKVTHKYTLIKPYLYEVRGKNRIEMYYHKSDGKSGQINIKDLEKAMIYPDIDDPEQILKILEELDGKEE